MQHHFLDSANNPITETINLTGQLLLFILVPGVALCFLASWLFDRYRARQWHRKWDIGDDEDRLVLLRATFVPGDVYPTLAQSPKTTISECRDRGISPARLHRARLNEQAEKAGLKLDTRESNRALVGRIELAKTGRIQVTTPSL